MASPIQDSADRLLVQIATYNTNLQGVQGLPQDLVDWLSPTFQVSNFLSGDRRAPDIVAVGFQELLPLHLGLSGFSRRVIEDRNAHILSQIEANAPNKEAYSLIAKVVNVGVGLLVYGRDDGISRRVCDVQTQWTGCGPLYMGNKGAIGVRFRLPTADGGIGETFTFVNAHLTAFEHRNEQRIADFHHIVGTLLFPPASANSTNLSTIYESSHLFFLGDLNFRLEIPITHPIALVSKMPQFSETIASESAREELKQFDQLTVAKNEGDIFIGFHEGEFWKFKCSYKYNLGKVDEYSTKRTPSWTDRVLYTTHTDSPDTPEKSNITNLLYTSIPSYTTSDHKPIVCLLLLPPSSPSGWAPEVPPTIRLPEGYAPTPDPRAVLKRYVGRTFDRTVGIMWYILTLLGAGSGLVGFCNAILGFGAWAWWKSKPVSDVRV